MKWIDQNSDKEITELLLGRKVIAVLGNDTLVLDTGMEIEVVPNSGCSGCASGGYGIDYINSCEAVITSVRLSDEDGDPHGEDAHIYKIHVLAANKEQVLLSVSGDDGNGCYGTGYTLNVKIP